MTSNSFCYDCGQPKHRGVACVPWAAPAPGTSYRLERYIADGLTGAFAVDIIGPDGRTIIGALDSRARCERLLKIRGFRGPFRWPTVEESRAARAARREGVPRG